MKRYRHYWWPLTGQRYPSRIVVLDCESHAYPDAINGRVEREALVEWHLHETRFVGGLPTGTKRTRGHESHDLWKRIGGFLTSKERTWLFCPAASRVLGLIGFWPRLEAGDIALVGTDRRAGQAGGDSSGTGSDALLVIEDPPTVILCAVGSLPGKLLILDVQNWGFELIPREVNCGDRVLRYSSGLCDCVSSLRSSGFGTVRGTAGGQAMQALRSAGDCIRLHCHTVPAVLSLERSAYYGGRCEATRLGDIPCPVYHVDVRNMYPSLCLDLPIPTCLVRYADGPQSASIVARGGGNNCAAHVRVQTNCPLYPLRRGDGTVYPTGQFNTYLCGAELNRAISEGAITRWYAAAEYECSPLLRSYYGKWLEMLASARTHGRAFESQWIKGVMNSLVGKFGEPGRRWLLAKHRPEFGNYHNWTETDDSGNVVRWRNVGGYTQYEEVKGESYWSMPAVAAWITAAGRMRLWSYIETAGRANVWYYDTDSLLCRPDGYARLLYAGLVRDGEAGYLRCLGQHSSCHIFGIRHYALDGKVTCAGVPRGTIEPAETRGAYWLRRRLATMHDMGSSAGSSRELMSYPNETEYHHGRVNPDGSITPWEVYDGSNESVL